MKRERNRTKTVEIPKSRLKQSGASRTTAEDIPELYEFAPGIGLTRVPVLERTHEQLLELPLDAATRRLLAFVDGASSFARILKVADVPIVDALSVCRGLIKHGIVEVRASN